LLEKKRKELERVKKEARNARMNSARRVNLEARQELAVLTSLDLLHGQTESSGAQSSKEKAETEWARRRALERVRDEKSRAKRAIEAEKLKIKEEAMLKSVARESRIKEFLERQGEKKTREREKYSRNLAREKRLQGVVWEEREGEKSLLEDETRHDGDKVHFTNELRSSDFERDSLSEWEIPKAKEKKKFTGTKYFENWARDKKNVVEVVVENRTEAPSINATTMANTKITEKSARFDVIPKCSPNTINVIRGASDVISAQQNKIKEIQERVKARLESYVVKPASPLPSPSRSPTRNRKPIIAPTNQPTSPDGKFSSPSRDDQRQALKSTFNIVVHLSHISGLPDLLSSVNSYVILEIGNSKQRSEIVKNSTDPNFDQSFLFRNVNVAREKHLRCSVFSNNLFVSDEYIGQCLCPLVSELSRDGEEMNFPVLSKTNYQNGSLYVKITKSFWVE